MSKRWVHDGLLAALAVAGCGSTDESALSVDVRSEQRIEARFVADPESVRLSATSTSAFVGDVMITLGPLAYDVHYDFTSGEVVADGHDGALDRPSHALLRDVIDEATAVLAPAPDPERALHEQMLLAGLVLLQESGGMPLGRLVFRLDAPEVDKSLGNDGVTCIDQGGTYPVSFDNASGTIIDTLVTADVDECNGRCGPGCTPLTPWAMWTLDCLEHDTCCDGSGEGLRCWTPLGQCGDEYVDAETDFLRGFDPLRKHCGG